MSETLPENLRYTKEHEWARSESDGTVTIGITAHAVDQLGDITMLTLPEVGSNVDEGGSMGDIDSVKAVSELYAPIAGEVVATNEALESAPEQVNSDPYGDGWMVRIKPASNDALASLLDVAGYREFIAD